MKRKRQAPDLPPDVARQAKDAVAMIALAGVLHDATAKGYVIQFVPAGDPDVWRALAERGLAILEAAYGGDLGTAPAAWREDAIAFRKAVRAAVAAYTLQRPADAPQAQPEKTT